MARLIDAELVEEKIRNLATEIAKDTEQDDDFSTGRWGGLHMALYRIETAPTIDAVPVVRCGECGLCNTVDCPMSGTPGRVSASDYCSYGERRADNGQ